MKPLPTRYIKGIAGFCGLLVSTATLVAQTWTWNGSASSDWFSPANWTPASIPSAAGIINITNGTVNLSSPVSLTGQLNWSGGTLNGTGLSMASNGVINILSNVSLFCPLTNNGTANWQAGNIAVYNYPPAGYSGAIWNESGALWQVQCDQNITGIYGYEFFNNSGTVRKTAGTNTTIISVSFTNTGLVDAESGVIELNAGGNVGGTFQAATSAAVSLASGAFNGTFAGTLTWFNGGQIAAGSALTVGTNGVLDISGNVILFGPLTNYGAVNWLAGTVAVNNYPPANYSGGIWNESGALWQIQSDQNMTQTYGYEFFNNSGTVRKTAGTNTTGIAVSFTNSGVVDAQSGTIQLNGGGGTAGTFQAETNAAIFLSAGLFQCNGQVISQGPGLVQVAGGSLRGMFTGNINWSAGQIPAGSSLTVAATGVLNVLGNVLLFGPLTNYGTINWLGGTVTVENYSPANYSGAIWNEGGALCQIQCDQNIIGIYGNEFFVNSGTLQKSAGTNITSIAISFTNTGLVDAQSGIIQLNDGGSLTGNFQSEGAGAVSLGSGPFNGTFSGALSWFTGGQIAPDSSLTVGTNGVLNILGNVSLFGPLTNYGTVNWLGGTVTVENYPPANYSGALWNEAGAAWQIQSDQNITPIYGYEFFNNAGLIQKTAGTNSTTIAVSFTNQNGAVTVDSGNLSLGGSIYSQGTGALAIQLGGTNTGQSGKLITTANAALSGPFDLALASGYVPATGTQFQVLSAGTISNTFASLALPDGFLLNYSNNGVFATFTGYPSFQITVSNNPSGAGSITGAGAFLAGTTNVVAANPAAGFGFANWTLNGVVIATTPSLSVVVNSNIALTANYTTVTWANPPSIVYGTALGTNQLNATASVPGTFAYIPPAGKVLNAGTDTLSVVFTPTDTLHYSVITNFASIVVTPAPLVVSANSASRAYGATNPAFTGTISGLVNGDNVTASFSSSATAFSLPGSYPIVPTPVDPGRRLGNYSVTIKNGTLTVLPTSPLVSQASANYENPVPVTTNLILTFRFDFPMNSNIAPVVVLTNSGTGAVQPAVPAGGSWTTTVYSNDTYSTAYITLTGGMNGTNQVFISSAQDVFGDVLLSTNVAAVIVDAIPPVLSSIAAVPGDNSALVTWNSDKVASSEVEYGLSAGYGQSTPLDGTLVNAHTVTVSGLIPATLYHYRVDSTDLAGNESVSGDNIFTTLAAPDLSVTNVVAPASASAGQSVQISWTEFNQGSAPAPGPWFDEVYLNNSNSIGGQLLGDFQFTNNLAAGKSSIVTQIVTLPPLIAGSQWVIVKVNAANSFYELNFSNNTAISSQTIMVMPTLQLALNPVAVSESAGTNAVLATLTRNGETSAALIVQLSTATGTNVYVPPSVTIPPGENSSIFSIGPIDNFYSGPSIAENISAAAAGFATATTPLTILENDPATLGLNLSASSINQNAGSSAITGTVSRNANLGQPLTVTLISDNPAALTVPGSVVIPSGQASAVFGLTPVPVAGISDTREANVSVSAPGFAPVTATVLVLNTNSVELSLALQTPVVSKGAGNSADVGILTVPSVLAAPENVLLTVLSNSLLTVPGIVTIPAGTNSVQFNIAVTNDFLVTGTQTATLLAQLLTPDEIPLTNGEATATLQILDVNGPTLTLVPAASTLTKTNSTTMTVARNTPATNSLNVTLTSAPAGVVTLPTNVVLAVNQTNATFVVSGIPTNTTSGSELVVVSASATGFNPAATPLTVSDIYLPDLTPTAINLATNALTGGQFAVSWVISNIGLEAATNQTWYDFLYLATDPAGQNKSLIGAVPNVSSLAVGASYTNQASFAVPPTPGSYWIIVVTDGSGAIAELNEENNSLISPNALTVNPAYLAEITEANPPAAAEGTPIVLSGRTYNPANNQPVPNAGATVNVQVNGTTRTYSVTSDVNGNFSYTFQPLSNEAGDYTAGADYPFQTQVSSQISFILLGMQAAPASLAVQLLPNIPSTGQIVLSNLTEHALTGVTLSANAQSNLTAQFQLTNTTLPANGTLTVNYTLQSSASHTAQIGFAITATSSEGAQISIPVVATVVPLVPQLIANPSYLVSGMVVGQQSMLSFTVLNTGGAASGDLTVQLPTNITWMTLGSVAIIPSIPAGGSNSVTLLLNPPANLPPALYSGSVECDGSIGGVTAPFQIRAVSSAQGELLVTATDDYTYYVAGAPKVANATITVRDAVSLAIVGQTNSDTNGLADFPSLPVGNYSVEATAAQHNQFLGMATVSPGVATPLEAFMPRALVTYQWTVVPTEVQDQYQIVLESVFETAVPVPNVVVSEPQVVVPVEAGAVSQFIITLSNEGLIEAQGVTIAVPSDPTYLLTPLVTNVGIIPAQSTVQIPVTVQLLSAPVPSFLKDIRRIVRHDSGGCNPDDSCLPNINLEVEYEYPCGNNNVQQGRPVGVTPVCGEDGFKECVDSALETSKSENIVSLGCNAISEILTCSGHSLSPCAKAALNTGCGALAGGLEGGIGGAIAGGVEGGEGDIAECVCTVLKNQPLPSFLVPSGATGSGGGGFGGGFSIPTYSFFTGYSVGASGTASRTVTSVPPQNTDTPVQGNDCSSGSVLTAKAITTRAPTVSSMTPRLKRIIKLDSGEGVCAHVQLQIDQSVVISRTAFEGSLVIDDGGSNSISGIEVNLEFRDATNGDASADFVIEGPVVSNLTAVDGTGTLAGGASGSANYTFIPTDAAAPLTPATYQIGGTLSYMDSGQQVIVPLLSTPITVYPEAQLDLLYFQQRDVYGSDPLDPQLSVPSQPFALGLIVKNVGGGTAHNFQITSAQPQLVDNQKGLLINFSIIGTELGDQPLTPSLTANLGDLTPGASKEVTWQLLSSQAGKFISLNASFSHTSDLGVSTVSLINSVEIHSLIHQVLANRPTDDDVPDFLVNDIPNPNNLPDTLYLSDGTIAAVDVVTNGTFDGPVTEGHLQVQLTSTVSNGWNYIQLPDPGAGYLLANVVRSDGEVLPLTNDAWTTALVFPSSTPAPVSQNLVHLFDWAGTGSYTLFYRSTNTTPPAIVELGTVTPFNQSGAVSSIDIVFSEPIDVSTFNYSALTLTANGGPNLINSGAGVSLTLVSNATYSINGVASVTAADANYQLTFNPSAIQDLWGNNGGNAPASISWAKGNVAPVVQSIAPVTPSPRNFAVPSVTVMFSKALNPATFNTQALSLTLNNGPNLINGGVTITAQSSTTFVIGGLASLTGAQGNYVFTVNAAAVQDTGGLAGFSSQSVNWSMNTTGPTITALEPITTNPRNIVVPNLTVTFSEPINLATFDYNDVTLTLNGGPNLISSEMGVSQISPTMYEITNLNLLQGYAGTYSLTVNADGILDLAGNAGSGSTNESWQLVLETPLPPTNLAISPTLILSGSVAASSMTVLVADATTDTSFGQATVAGTNFTIPLSFSVDGMHQIQANAVDNAGNVSLASFINYFVGEPPVLAPMSNLVVTADGEAIEQVFATDPNGNALTYGLGAGEPTNAVISQTGTNVFFSWIPTRAYAETTNLFIVIATDNGVPPMSGSQTFSVTVLDYLQLTIGSTNVQGGQATGVPISLSSSGGVTNLTFAVQVPENVLSNVTVSAIAPQIAFAGLQDFKTNIAVSVTVVPGQTLSGTQSILDLNFIAGTNPPSAFIQLIASNIDALKPSGSPYVNYIAEHGVVAVVEDRPLLSASVSTNLQHTLVLYGNVGASYQLQYATNLFNPNWQPVSEYAQINGVVTINLVPTNAMVFYRLQEK